MQFRSATNADCPRIQELVFTILREFQLEPDPSDVDADIADVETSYINRGGAFEVLLKDGRIIGTVGVYPAHDQVCELRKMYLERAERGSGSGRRLLEHAIATALRLGFRRMELETASRLVDAIRLYRAFGFQEINSRVCPRCDQAFAMDL